MRDAARHPFIITPDTRILWRRRRQAAKRTKNRRAKPYAAKCGIPEDFQLHGFRTVKRGRKGHAFLYAKCSFFYFVLIFPKPSVNAHCRAIHWRL